MGYLISLIIGIVIGTAGTLFLVALNKPEKVTWTRHEEGEAHSPEEMPARFNHPGDKD